MKVLRDVRTINSTILFGLMKISLSTSPFTLCEGRKVFFSSTFNRTKVRKSVALPEIYSVYEVVFLVSSSTAKSKAKIKKYGDLKKTTEGSAEIYKEINVQIRGLYVCSCMSSRIHAIREGLKSRKGGGVVLLKSKFFKHCLRPCSLLYV